ncbi:MAG TPA: NIPSNAP family protein [Tepidisphaeraceae bacterium]|nr:NIPSNAP family protein [Tepidisphaeraceae bacterium]
MKRREFLAASAAAVVGAMGAAGFGQGQSPAGRQFFELRTYHFASSEKQQAFEQFMQSAAVPALNRAGVQPVGVFKPVKTTRDAKETDLFVLLPHDSIESVITLEDRLAGDQAFQSAGHAVLNAGAKDPAYTRYESMLLYAMKGAPHVQALTQAESRVFELRTYESPNAERARSKLDMFNGGEFEIFRKAGMPGVFFGGALAGARLPQLTYMVVHENMEDSDSQWKAFFSQPEWKKLTADKSYNGNVSKVIDIFLRPAGGSQI